MIRFKSIAEQRLDAAFANVQEVIKRKGNGLSDDKLKFIPSARKNKDASPEYLEVQKTYHQYVKSFAMLVLNSGLVAALLYAQGKANKKEAYGLIIDHVTAWLNKQGHAKTSGKDAIKELYAKKGYQIRPATLEAIRFLEDLKRVADARLYKPAEKTKNNG